MRLRGTHGAVIVYTPEFDGRVRKRIFQRPVPRNQISADITDCSVEIMKLWGLFVTVVARASHELMASTFTAGKPTTQIQRIANTTLAKVANDPDLEVFKQNYQHISDGPVCRWLTETPEGHLDSWDFSAGTINNHPFSSLLAKETTNTVCFKLFIVYFSQSIPFRVSVISTT